MALHSKKDFAIMCGLSTGNLANNITRGKVITTGKFIDDKIEKNQFFLKKWQEKSTGRVMEAEQLTERVKEEKVEVPKIPNVQPVNDPRTKAPKIVPPKGEKDSILFGWGLRMMYGYQCILAKSCIGIKALRQSRVGLLATPPL